MDKTINNLNRNQNETETETNTEKNNKRNLKKEVKRIINFYKENKNLFLLITILFIISIFFSLNLNNAILLKPKNKNMSGGFTFKTNFEGPFSKFLQRLLFIYQKIILRIMKNIGIFFGVILAMSGSFIFPFMIYAIIFYNLALKFKMKFFPSKNKNVNKKL